MFPSSAAMLKNLQQTAMTSPFLMENLLQSKASPGTDLTSLTLNWAASLVARQRERECEASLRLARDSRSSPSDLGQDHLEQRSGITRDRMMIDCRDQQRSISGGGRSCERQHDRMQLLQREKEILVDRSQGVYMDVENERMDGPVVVDRLCAMERLCNERIDNRSNSGVESCNSNVDEDPILSAELEGGGPQAADRDEMMLGERVSAIEIDRRYDLGCRNVMHTSDEMTITSGERETVVAAAAAAAVERAVDRIGERTTACSCGDEQCTGPACRTIQEKEKPQLKFSVSAILGGNHDRRPHPGNSVIYVPTVT